ncbi:MAG: ELWxxDGT repeat protein [Acidobacteriota bacterium]
MGDEFFFVATDGLHGYELWRSDGSTAGTRMVRDLCSGLCSSMPQRLSVVNDRLYFVAWTTEAVSELWTSDGTAQGTVRLELRPGPPSWGLSALMPTEDLLLFFLSDSAGNRELWRSDGTVAGTRSVRLFDQGTSPQYVNSGVTLGDRGAFVMRVDLADEVWASDGTTSGTRRLASFPFGERVLNLRATTSHIFFQVRKSSSEYELWSSDGTASGTQLALSSRFPMNSSEPFGDLLMFIRDRHIWASDGTEQGTRVWRRPDCRPGTLTASAIGLFFSCRDEAGYEPWFSDGTSRGTQRLADTVPGETDGITRTKRFLASSEGALFAAPKPGDPNQSVVWFSDGTPSGTRAVQGTEKLSWFYRGGQTSAGFLFRRGLTSHAEYFVLGAQGVPATTLGSLNRQTSSYADSFSALPAGRTFFQTRRSSGSSARLTENWTLEGAAATPFDLDPSNGDVEEIFAPSFEQVEDRLFFLATEPGVAFCPFTNSPYPHVSLLRSLALDLSDAQRPGPFVPGSWLKGFDGTLYSRRFAGCSSFDTEVAFFEPSTGLEGSVQGPLPLMSLWLRRNEWVEGGNRLYVPSREGVWSISRTRDATDSLAEAQNSDSFAVTSTGTVFFSAETPGEGREVWSLPTGGTPRLLSVRAGPDAGVFRLLEQNLEPYGRRAPQTELLSEEATAFPPDFAVLDDHYFFVADDGLSGVELWSTSATGPPALVADLAPGSSSSLPNNLLVAGGRLYFRADDGVHGSELWMVDAPGSAPVMLGDLQPGSGSSVPQQFADVGGQLLFSADDGVHGRELWVSDGTPGGTWLAADIAAGPASSSPSGFYIESTRVLFSANDGLRGFEIWALDRPLAGPGGIFRSGFESGDNSSWAAEVP